MGRGIAVVSTLFFLAVSGPCLAVQPVAIPSAKKCYALPNAEAVINSLEHAQTSWRAYRDAHCDMVAELFMNGSGKAVGGFVCTIDLTRLRIHELWEYGGFLPRRLPEPK
jgi:uncharacterized protein YecT (DUF1311 family)